MSSVLGESPRRHPAGRASLKRLLFLPILFSVLAGRGLLPIALAQTQTANDSAVDKWLHELYSAFGIGPGGSRTPVPTSTVTSTASTASSSSQNRTQAQTPKTPSQGQGDGGFRSAHGASQSANGTGTGRRDQGHAVFANFVVRNAEKYTIDCWMEGIKLAVSAGFDAFALSVGNESWEARQVANAFCAASKVNSANKTRDARTSRSAFKLFLSFNMTSLPCSRAEDVDTLQQYIRMYANHSDYFRYNGRMLVSTFAGEECRFGEGCLDEGWKHALRAKSTNGSAIPDVWFVPAFFAPPHALSNLTAIDGLFNWNSAWPSRGFPTASATDQSYISALKNRTYMSAVSLWSWVQRDRNEDESACGTHAQSFGARWESLVRNRGSVSLVEVVTWGDELGRSDGGASDRPLSSSHGAKPAESRNSSRSDSFSVRRPQRKGILEQIAPLMKYYVEAFKSGSYPPVARDEIVLWVEAHPRRSNCSGLNQETGRKWIQDRVSAYALLSEPGNATLTCGPWSNSTAGPCGLSKLGLTLHDSECCKAEATLTHNSKTSMVIEQQEEVDMTWVRRWIPLSADWESDEDLAVLVPVPVA